MELIADIVIGLIITSLVLIILDCMKREYTIVKDREKVNKAKLNNLIDDLEQRACDQSFT